MIEKKKWYSSIIAFFGMGVIHLMVATILIVASPVILVLYVYEGLNILKNRLKQNGNT